MNPPSPTKSMIGQLPHSGDPLLEARSELADHEVVGHDVQRSSGGLRLCLEEVEFTSQNRIHQHPACIPPVFPDESQSAGVFTPPIPSIACPVGSHRDSRVEEHCYEVPTSSPRVSMATAAAPTHRTMSQNAASPASQSRPPSLQLTRRKSSKARIEDILEVSSRVLNP
jgi:hypothetical protein